MSSIPLNVVILGSSSSGKTSLVRRYAASVFSEEHVPTPGIEYQSRTLQIDEQTVKLQIWDTSGEERFSAVLSNCFRSANAVIVVFDMTNRTSFKGVGRWLTEIRRHCKDRVVAHLVGTKCDVSDAAVSCEEGQQFARAHDLPFSACSARTGEHVDQIFWDVACSVSRVLVEEKQERLRLKTPLVVTVTASHIGQCTGAVTLSACNVAGENLGACHIDNVNSLCFEGLSALRAAMNVDPRQSVRFVTADGVPMYFDTSPEYEESPIDASFIVETPEDFEDIGSVVKSFFERYALHIEDIDSGVNPVCKDRHGKPCDIYAADGIRAAEDLFPLAVVVKVRKRKKPMTLACAFNIETQVSG
eukprot:TRINITY_DN75801_c0_g1_i2.p1 TRINITY_DN75801_c0_g1~~TRINITY_DN75801_c0_g1_i2.p1  ORF type:complete len:359 (-),score=22.34 TRINITY_DN75801_c0_g1_i2:96-1172(-)